MLIAWLLTIVFYSLSQCMERISIHTSEKSPTFYTVLAFESSLLLYFILHYNFVFVSWAFFQLSYYPLIGCKLIAVIASLSINASKMYSTHLLEYIICNKNENWFSLFILKLISWKMIFDYTIIKLFHLIKSKKQMLLNCSYSS